MRGCEKKTLDGKEYREAIEGAYNVTWEEFEAEAITWLGISTTPALIDSHSIESTCGRGTGDGGTKPQAMRRVSSSLRLKVNRKETHEVYFGFWNQDLMI